MHIWLQSRRYHSTKPGDKHLTDGYSRTNVGFRVERGWSAEGIADEPPPASPKLKAYRPDRKVTPVRRHGLHIQYNQYNKCKSVKRKEAGLRANWKIATDSIYSLKIASSPKIRALAMTKEFWVSGGEGVVSGGDCGRAPSRLPHPESNHSG